MTNRHSQSLFVSNIQSLLPKYDKICAVVSSLKHHFLLLCEIWLTSDIGDEDLSVPGSCNLLRRDIQDGGVIVYIRCRLQGID